MNHSLVLKIICLTISSGTLLLPFNATAFDLTEDDNREQEIYIDAMVPQTYDELMQQARFQVQQLIEQRFSEMSSIHQITIRVVGDRHGQQVPVLIVQVTRSGWYAQPNIDEWARELGTAPRTLLGFTDALPQASVVADESVADESAIANSSPRRSRGRGRGSSRRQVILNR
jgi:hypothetical protein